MGKKSKGMSPRMRRASGTNDAVERVLTEMAQLTAEFGGSSEIWENVARMRRGLEVVWSQSVLENTTLEQRIGTVDLIARYTVVDLWRRQGRVAYDVNPEFANSLYRADMKGKLPGELFSRLKHISPMIPLPHPWPFRNHKGKEDGLIRAFFITGRTGRAFCTTTDPRSEGICIVPFIDFHDRETGEVCYTATPVLAMPSTDQPFTLDDVIRTTNRWHGTVTEDSDRRFFKQLIPGAVSLLTYLCCSNRDVQEPPPPPVKGKRQQAPPRDPYYVRVGWHIGPKLHAVRIRATGRTRDGVSIPSGVEYGPQHRAAHFKTVHFGPKRQQWDVKFVEPYWTKREMLDGQEPATQVVPVDPQSGDPSSYKDIRRANLGTAKSREIAAREKQQQRQDDWEF